MVIIIPFATDYTNLHRYRIAFNSFHDKNSPQEL